MLVACARYKITRVNSVPMDVWPSHHNGPFYRVYDYLSQSQNSREKGFFCRDEKIYLFRPELRFSRNLVKKYMDWNNREPTSYISVFASLEKAFRECDRRLANPVLGRRVAQGQVQVSIVAGLKVLQREGVFVSSLAELRRTSVLKHDDDDFAYGDEWLVLDRIPASCVLADGTIEQFIQHSRRV